MKIFWKKIKLVFVWPIRGVNQNKNILQGINQNKNFTGEKSEITYITGVKNLLTHLKITQAIKNLTYFRFEI